MNATDTPRIYVASLADYNAGRLHGRWIDADQDAEDIMAEVRAMLAESPEPFAEEWAIHDIDGFEGIDVGEYESFEQVSEWAQGIAEHGPAYAAWVSHDPAYNTDPDAFEDAYQGEWDSLEAYAGELLEDTGLLAEVPESLRGYIDVEAYARDMELNGDVYTVSAGGSAVYVFLNY